MNSGAQTHLKYKDVIWMRIIALGGHCQLIKQCLYENEKKEYFCNCMILSSRLAEGWGGGRVMGTSGCHHKIGVSPCVAGCVRLDVTTLVTHKQPIPN